jgi:hypothetical protein
VGWPACWLTRLSAGALERWRYSAGANSSKNGENVPSRPSASSARVISQTVCRLTSRRRRYRGLLSDQRAEQSRHHGDAERGDEQRQELGLGPRECFVVEDAAAGVEAAKAGKMAALGVARADDAELLGAAAADLVVTTLDEVDLDRLSEGRLGRR